MSFVIQQHDFYFTFSKFNKQKEINLRPVYRGTFGGHNPEKVISQ